MAPKLRSVRAEVADLPEPNRKIAREVLEHVRAIARERAKNLSLDTNIVVDLGLDSLERMQIANSLEETFGGRFPEEVLQQIETCRETALAIEKYLGTEPRVQGRFHASGEPSPGGEIPPENYEFAQMPEYVKLQQTKAMLSATGIPNPFFSVHESITNDRTVIGGRELISFASYNYLGMSGDPVVSRGGQGGHRSIWHECVGQSPGVGRENAARAAGARRWPASLERKMPSALWEGMPPTKRRSATCWVLAT